MCPGTKRKGIVINMETVDRVYELAAKRNISINRLAEISGISLSTIKTTKSRGGQLKVDTIERICTALGIPLYMFFMEDNDHGAMRSDRQ